jgi:predicted transcriptional regulator
MLNLTKNQAALLGLILAFPHTWQEEDAAERCGITKHAAAVALNQLVKKGFVSKRGRLATGLVTANDKAMTFMQEGAHFASNEEGFPL